MITKTLCSCRASFILIFVIIISVSDSAKKKKNTTAHEFTRRREDMFDYSNSFWHKSFQGLLPINIYAQILHLMSL